jgi:hypothetical protein
MQSRLGFRIDSVLIKREAYTLLFSHQTGCLKIEALFQRFGVENVS